MVSRPVGRALLFVFIVLVVALAVLSPSAGAMAVHESASADTTGDRGGWNASAIESTAASTHTPPIRQTFTYEALPDRDGYVAVTLSYVIPDDVSQLHVTLSPAIEDVDPDGFTRESTRQFSWTESTQTPSITYTVPINEYVHAQNGYRFYDAGDWAIIPTQEWSLNWYAYRGDPGVTTTHNVTGPGIAGTGMVYLGEHEIHTRESTREMIRLVVPAAADLASSPTDILSVLVDTSDTLDTRDVDAEIMLIAAPTEGVNWGPYGGVQRGNSDAWVRDSARTTNPQNTWIHEYVHTKQPYRDRLTPETRWLTEGHAEYHGALLNYQFGHLPFRDFRTALARGTQPMYDDIVLSEPASWTGTLGNYHKGALAIAAIDYEIRAATDGERSFQDVVRAMNTHGGSIDHGTFLDLVHDAGGSSARTVADRYTTTTRTPEVWDESTHTDVFHSEFATFTYTVVGTPESRYEVRGDYRETTIGTGPVLVTNETLTATVMVRNTGDRSGTYRAALTVDGTLADEARGTLDPGTHTNTTLSYQFTDPGEYTMTIGTTQTTVIVRDPAQPTVDALTVSTETLALGDDLTIAVTVNNPADVPGTRSVTITADDQPIHTESVVLQPNTTRNVTTTYEPTTTGIITITAGAHPRTIMVTEQTPSIPVPQPGFGIVVTVVALALLAMHGRIWNPR